MGTGEENPAAGRSRKGTAELFSPPLLFNNVNFKTSFGKFFLFSQS